MATDRAAQFLSFCSATVLWRFVVAGLAAGLLEAAADEQNNKSKRYTDVLGKTPCTFFIAFTFLVKCHHYSCLGDADLLLGDFGCDSSMVFAFFVPTCASK